MRPCPLFLTLAILLLPLPGLAQSQRHATEIEIERMVLEMRQGIPKLMQSGYYSDRRSPEEYQQQAAFVETWSEIDGAIAPFLGDWSAMEENLLIYPLPAPGEVCIIDSRLDESDFYQGRVVNGNLYTDTNLIFVLDSGFLVNISVYDDQAYHYEYANPRPVENPTTSTYYREYHPQIVVQFQQAGCLVKVPE
ncbi:hypothetical protein H6G89_15505 [Oscillatoria sp. FACHB-1407]|uniref:hypothetical protein n=1 Tax=Oscillatoria sp. FACHB-1407 TaxID=2692847 RepID=UPI001685A312|nr:hypothetical protein [Oscillatoria sp. FACHB-1407]MBD2462453.1 hypothetical protein [Oscillatoria sp. FACHB-1407]